MGHCARSDSSAWSMADGRGAPCWSGTRALSLPYPSRLRPLTSGRRPRLYATSSCRASAPAWTASELECCSTSGGLRHALLSPILRAWRGRRRRPRLAVTACLWRGCGTVRRGGFGSCPSCSQRQSGKVRPGRQRGRPHADSQPLSFLVGSGLRCVPKGNTGGERRPG